MIFSQKIAELFHRFLIIRQDDIHIGSVFGESVTEGNGKAAPNAACYGNYHKGECAVAGNDVFCDAQVDEV